MVKSNFVMARNGLDIFIEGIVLQSKQSGHELRVCGRKKLACPSC
jgi:hypothetical protein